VRRASQSQKAVNFTTPRLTQFMGLQRLRNQFNSSGMRMGSRFLRLIMVVVYSDET
jgi:hypothetical protein